MPLPQDALSAIVGLNILIGAAQCFFGYRIFKFVLGMTGFLLGGVAAGVIGYAMSQETAVALLAGLVGGLIGAVLMIAFYFVGVFLVGALLGGIAGVALYAAAGSQPEPAVLLILAVIAGILAVVVQKFMIVVATGFGGAWGVVTGIAYFTTGAIDPTNIERFLRSRGSELYAILLCWAALGITCVIVQYRADPTLRAGKDTALPSAADP